MSMAAELDDTVDSGIWEATLEKDSKPNLPQPGRVNLKEPEKQQEEKKDKKDKEEEPPFTQQEDEEIAQEQKQPSTEYNAAMNIIANAQTKDELTGAITSAKLINDETERSAVRKAYADKDKILSKWDAP